MGTDDIAEIRRHIETEIAAFHQRRLDSLRALKLRPLLARKNPYLFRAKNIRTAAEFVKALLDAHLSSQEETLFGGVLERIAIAVCARAFGGRKSSAEGIDLEFERDGVLYLVTIKSGPNWGNSSQIKQMQAKFRQAKRILGTNAAKQRIEAVNGCCYGCERAEQKEDYVKKCGRSFWEFISGDESTHTRILEAIGHDAQARDAELREAYGAKTVAMVTEFEAQFCTAGGIEWELITQL